MVQTINAIEFQDKLVLKIEKIKEVLTNATNNYIDEIELNKLCVCIALEQFNNINVLDINDEEKIAFYL